MAARPNISKSQYIKGLQSIAEFWCYRHGKKNVTEEFNDENRQMRFRLGNEVGELAQKYYAGGVTVTEPFWAIEKGVEATKSFIADGKNTIYEATAVHPGDGSYSRIDILKKVRGTDEWDLVEVKSAASVKPYYLDDLAFQYHVFKGAGYKIRKTSLMLIDTSYVRQGEIEPRKLFKLEDVTREVLEKQAEVSRNIAKLNSILKLSLEPQDMPLSNLFNVSSAAGSAAGYGYDIAGGLFDDTETVGGYTAVDEIFPQVVSSKGKAIEADVHQNNQPHVDKGEIRRFLKKVEYPIYYLDYEAVLSPVPLYNGTRPYQQIPFQFSLHIQEKPGAAVKHVAFLHKKATDPRKALVKALVDAIGDKGSVVVYNQSFEKARNRELAATFPQYARKLNSINDRVVDLYDLFRNRALYHQEQEGSASLKKVLDAWTGISYKNMGIGDGLTAMNRYMSFVKGDMDAKQTKKLWADLLLYSRQDTYAMVALVKTLRSLASGRAIPQTDAGYLGGGYGGHLPPSPPPAFG